MHFYSKNAFSKRNYFLTLWNFTNLKDTSFGKKSCNFEHGLETKNKFEKWPLITFFQCIFYSSMNAYSALGMNAYSDLMFYSSTNAYANFGMFSSSNCMIAYSHLIFYSSMNVCSHLIFYSSVNAYSDLV